MGLDNLVGDDAQNVTSETQETDEQYENKRTYAVITRDEFEEFLKENTSYFWNTVDVEADELVYQTDEFMFTYPDVALRIFSTIDDQKDIARGKGEDAIRTVIWSISADRPIGGRKKTLRITTWKKNLKKKIISLSNEWEEYITQCPQCKNGWLVERKGKYGKFLGCTNWSDDGGCDYIERHEEPDNYVKECPSCNDGFLIERDGPYGEFLGCINWKKDGSGCDHKEQID